MEIILINYVIQKIFKHIIFKIFHRIPFPLLATHITIICNNKQALSDFLVYGCLQWLWLHLESAPSFSLFSKLFFYIEETGTYKG